MSKGAACTFAACAEAPEVLAVGNNLYRPSIRGFEIDFSIGFEPPREARLPLAFKSGLFNESNRRALSFAVVLCSLWPHLLRPNTGGFYL